LIKSLITNQPEHTFLNTLTIMCLPLQSRFREISFRERRLATTRVSNQQNVSVQAFYL